ncbi:substrate-binding domain-containing protein, partial [Rhizobium ruizarguesonis]
LAAAENLITANPDLTAIYSTGEPALMGAIAAVQSQGNQDKIKVFGWDLTAEAIAGITIGPGLATMPLPERLQQAVI